MLGEHSQASFAPGQGSLSLCGWLQGGSWQGLASVLQLPGSTVSEWPQ